MSVPRRFSDFLGIHAKLAERHTPQGIVVPPAPEKSVIGKSRRKSADKDQLGSLIDDGLCLFCCDACLVKRGI